MTIWQLQTHGNHLGLAIKENDLLTTKRRSKYIATSMGYLPTCSSQWKQPNPLLHGSDFLTLSTPAAELPTLSVGAIHITVHSVQSLRFPTQVTREFELSCINEAVIIHSLWIIIKTWNFFNRQGQPHTYCFVYRVEGEGCLTFHSILGIFTCYELWL